MLNPHFAAIAAGSCRSRWLIGLCAAAPALALANVCAIAPAASVGSMSVADLKSAYLACDARGASSRLDPAVFRLCAEVAQTLQEKAFGGDLDQQLAWWRRAKASQTR